MMSLNHYFALPVAGAYISAVGDTNNSTLTALCRPTSTADAHWNGECVDETIDASSHILAPGFVNTHTHLWQAVARSVSPSDQLPAWVARVYHLSTYITGDELQQLVTAASVEALMHGTTTVIDFELNNRDTHADAVLRAWRDTKLGGALVYNHGAFLPPALFRAEAVRLQQQCAGVVVGAADARLQYPTGAFASPPCEVWIAWYVLLFPRLGRFVFCFTSFVVDIHHRIIDFARSLQGAGRVRTGADAGRWYLDGARSRRQDNRARQRGARRVRAPIRSHRRRILAIRRETACTRRRTSAARRAGNAPAGGGRRV